MTFCPHLNHCNGCHFGELPYSEQSQIKIQLLKTHFKTSSLSYPEINFVSLSENHLRTRFDFTLESDKSGLYDQQRNLVDLKSCAQLSTELEEAFLDFKKISFPIRKGSVRIRISPKSRRGIWLDFANIDIKNLLMDGAALTELKSKGFHIEIGQKGKTLAVEHQNFKLSDPHPQPWFQAKLANNKVVDLKCLMSNFTQPSWISAFSITDIIQNWISKISSRPLHVAEFGAGIGQFTLPLLSTGHLVDVFEFSAQATQFLNLNALENKLADNLTIYCGDYHKKEITGAKNYDVALVNPPRSGLKDFARQLIERDLKSCIYISCHPESLAVDLKTFTLSGFEIKDVILVDQFPQTKHFETCVLLQRVDS